VRRAATILASKAVALLRYGEGGGVDADRLLASASITRPSLARAGQRVDLRSIVALWSQVGVHFGDADIGLKLALGESDADAFGVVGFRAMTSDTVREGLLAFVRHCNLVADGSDAHLVEGDDTLTFELTLPAVGGRVGGWMIDRALASCLLLLKRWTGEPLKPRRVTFRHAAPGDTDVYDRVFDCRVDYAQPANTIAFGRDVAGLRLRTAQADVARYLESVAMAAEADLPASDAGGAVAHAVRADLAHGLLPLAVVARRLGVSARTLQRRLLAEGLSYAGVADRVRRETAVRLVMSTALPLTAVRERLGYEDDRAFRRAFRRWTGSSPVELRRER
jgi:AraC-like DNA-binding protein